jgi:hypothetical protein
MNQNIDLKTMIGFGSATGIPYAIHAVITFVHPALFTLTCGQGYVDGVAACYKNQCVEAVLLLVLSAVAVAYGLMTMAGRMKAVPSPPSGSNLAVIQQGQVPATVLVNGSGVRGPAYSLVAPGSAGDVTAISPSVPKGSAP